MTDHNIAELQRQYDQARGAALTASNRAIDALARLNAAKCSEMEAALAARGIVPGVKVIVTRTVTRDEIGIFTGLRLHYNSFEPVVAKIKKDGTAHATQCLWGCTTKNIALHTDGAS